MIHYQAIHKDKIETQINQRYQNEINRLRDLNFTDLQFAREVVFPFSAVVALPIIPMMIVKREVFRIEFPLRIVYFNPLMLNYEFDTYAHIFALGVSFYTLYSDNTILVSTNFVSTQAIIPEKKIFYYPADNKQTIEAIWELHIERLQYMERKGRETRPDLTLELFEMMSKRKGNAILLGR